MIWFLIYNFKKLSDMPPITIILFYVYVLTDLFLYNNFAHLCLWP